MRHGGLATNPSGSNCEAFVNCTSSHVLPQRNESSATAQKGTDGHAPLTEVINAKRWAVPGALRGTMVEKFPLEEVLRDVGLVRAEAAYAVNVKYKTVRFIGLDIGRNYGELGDYEVPVSLDADGFRHGRPWLRDWKFGRYSSVWQLSVQGMAVAFPRKEKPSVEPEVDAGFVYIDADTRGEEWEEERHVLYLSELETAADELVRAFDKVASIRAALDRGEVPRLATGSWCKYCGAHPYCPAKWSMVRAAMGELQSLQDMVGAMTVEKCGKAWEWVSEVERFCTKAKETLKERMETEPFPLSNGKLIELRKTKGWAYFDREPTRRLLKAKGATEEEIKGVMKARADAMTPRETVRK